MRVKPLIDDASTRWGYKRFAQSVETVGDGGHGSGTETGTGLFWPSKSPNDGPAGYELYLSTGEGDTWKLVASGKNAGSVQIISFPAEETSKFKIVQTGTKGITGRFDELYAACV